MKKSIMLVLLSLIMCCSTSVFAKDAVTVEKIIGMSLNENVVLNATDKIDVVFNDLKQDASYKITLKNNTDEVVYVNDVVAENLSEEFIEFSLTDKSLNTMIEPGKESDIEVEIKTLDITHAGRNVNEEVTLKFLLGDSVVNPETDSNWIVYVILIGTLLITVSTMFSKLDKKKKISIFVIGTLVFGTTVVSASDDNTLNLEAKVKYTSQNLLQESGTKLEGYKVNYNNSLDVWKYADLIKNIIILDNYKKIDNYKEKFDLTISDGKRIYGYVVENDDDNIKYDLFIMASGVIYAPEDSTGLFSFPNVETINGLEFIEFDNTTNMSAMFMNNKKIKYLNTDVINTSNAINVSYMFNGCDNLNVSESDFNLDRATNKNYMINQKLVNIVKTNAVSDKNVDFSAAPVAGKYLIESTKNDNNPVYYYRGSVTDNNVIFANLCWKMVRTTDTGGVKLIYNGTPAVDGSCNNSGAASQIGVSAFNSKMTSPAHVGYMFGTDYVPLTLTLENQSESYLYGNDIVWDGKNYILNGEKKVSSSWNNDRKILESKYHYTCFNDTGICENVYYINYFDKDNYAYYFTLDNGKNIDDLKDEMFNNITDSSIKTKIDNWFLENMMLYKDYLEDTVWCNDRTLASGPLFSKDDSKSFSSLFASNERTTSPSVICSNKRDSFTVSTINGNGKLTYPIGLLTADEYTLAGNGVKGYSTSSYLFSGVYQWTMSPSGFSFTNAGGFALTISGNISDTIIGFSRGGYVRPSVSLKNGTNCVFGTGTVNDPYIVE